MKSQKILLIGLALVLAFTLTIGMPGVSRAQQNGPAASSGTAASKYTSGYYNYNNNGSAYCPTGPGYGYSARASRNYGQRGPRSWNRGGPNDWCPTDSGYARNYRGGRGNCW